MAARYLVPGGNGNYNSTSNWSATSGGASGASVPTSADDVIINSLSSNAPLIINVLSQCKSFVCSSYTGIISTQDYLVINGAGTGGHITLSAGSTITGAGGFRKVGSSTGSIITSNGVIFDCNFDFASTATHQCNLTGTMVVNKNVVFSTVSTTITTTIGTNTLQIGGNLVMNHPAGSNGVSIIFIGSTTASIIQSPTSLSSFIITFNKTGILNISDFYTTSGAKTITYTAGVINHTGTLYIIGTYTFNTNGVNWNIISFTSGSMVLNSLLKANTLIKTNSSALTFSGTAGFEVDNFEYNVFNSFVLRFTAGRTYKIKNSIKITSTSNPVTWNTGVGTKAIVEVGEGAFMKLFRVNATNLTATKKVLRIVVGSVTNCDNILMLTSNIKQYNKTI